jgi:subtilisin family serine protease
MVLTSAEDQRRLVLVELRSAAGDDLPAAQQQFQELWSAVFGTGSDPAAPHLVLRRYYRCALSESEIRALVAADAGPTDPGLHRSPVIFRVWPDYVVRGNLDRSVATVQADAAARSYGCTGQGIVWAVMDSGIDATHPHFSGYANLTLPAVNGLHRDFTLPASPGGPLTDSYGHGTHIAGIIAGQASSATPLCIATNQPTEQGLPQWINRTLATGTTLSGIAPQTGLVSLKVLDDKGNTVSSILLEAIEYVRQINADGRDLQIHGVNMSLGCDWPPSDYAAGQSPLCKELDLLVGSGVTVVVSAGNAGAAGNTAAVSHDVRGQLSTITDPGNAAHAVTVGSVHRYKPHIYGVTFDSSKGPTLDGRRKPDLVAPGECITSAATGDVVSGIDVLQPGQPGLARYREVSGTSMAAAHVSGVIAALLSVRPEFIGQPELIKQMLSGAATDLGRHEFYQGAGLINLMRTLSNT